MMMIGTQTFGLEKELSQDLPGTLRILRDIGFQAVEPFVLFNEKQGRMPRNLWALDTLAQAKDIMYSLGMTIPSAHVGIGFGMISMPAGMVVKKLLALHESTGIRYFVVSGPFGTAASAKKWGKLLKKVSDGVKSCGCVIVCHNHDDEFRQIMVNGARMAALDYFFEWAGPDVLLELDIGWASLAGDEVEIARRYAGRIAALHLKDFYPGYREKHVTRANMPDEKFAPIGSGAVKNSEVLALCGIFPHFNGSIIIDQDKYVGNMVDSLKTGYRSICSMLNQEGR